MLEKQNSEIMSEMFDVFHYSWIQETYLQTFS